MREYRIIGPPGTGKTTFVARQVEGWRSKYGPDEILIASFTKTAAREIASRNLDIVEHNVGTLHSVCYRLLGKPPLAQSHVKDWNEWVDPRVPSFKFGSSRSASLDDPLADGLDEVEWSTPLAGDVAMSQAQTLRGKLADRSTWPSTVLQFDELWQEWKDLHGLYDFTDLLERCYLDYSAPAGIRIGCFDEVQDFSPLELALIRKWREDLDGVALVGDPDQCIYSFKGASPQAFLVPDIPKDDYRVLSQSHRVPASVHRLAVGWIEQSSWRYPFEYLPRAVEGAVEYRDGGSWLSLRTPDYVAREAAEYARQGKTVMVLASCGFHLAGVVAELKKRGVPFHNPYQAERGDWNPLRGSGDRLSAFLSPVRPDLVGATYEPRLWKSTEMIRWATDVRADGTFLRGGKEKLKARATDDSKIKNHQPLTLAELGWFMEPSALQPLSAALCGDEPWSWLDERLLPEARRRMSYALEVARKNGALALMQVPKVVIGTIHSVKGAQADVVILAPDLSASGHASWNGGPEPRDSVRRVFYVGMTRAQERLVLLGGMGAKVVQWNR